MVSIMVVVHVLVALDVCVFGVTLLDSVDGLVAVSVSLLCSTFAGRGSCLSVSVSSSVWSE